MTDRLTIKWAAAEPALAFDGFHGWTVRVARHRRPAIDIVWDAMRLDDDDAYVIHGWVFDHETGDGMDPINIPLSDVRHVRVL